MTQFDFSGESEEYRQKREELLAAEIALKNQVERVAAMRRQLPQGLRMSDYTFREGPADLSRNDPADFRDVHLADLFTNGHDTLIVDHLMFHPNDDAPCIMCAMWADGYNAVAPHVMQRTSFVLVAKAEIGKLRDWARRRGWDRVRLLSCYESTFNHDLNMEGADGEQRPGISVFTKAPDGAVSHWYSVGAELGTNELPGTDGRGIDLYSPLWNLLDLLPQGRGADWYPSHGYMERHAASAIGQ